MNEQSSVDFWTNNSIITILGQFFDFLRAYIANKSCPNYFIPNNLMRSTYTDKQINSLLTRLDDVCQDIFYYIICCDIFNFADNELLASLYKTITLAGNQSDVTEILTSIYLSDFINRCNKEFLQLGGIKRVNRYKFIHYYYHNFMRFCLGRFLVGVPLHLKQELLKVTKRIDELYYSSYLMECANMYINRCLAIIAFSALFHEQTQMKNKLMKDSEKLFLLSVDVPGELSDGGISGGVYLGLFYYLTDQREKTKLILGKTAKSALEHYQLWRKFSLPILLINEKTRLLKCPSYLVNEDILRDLFEKWHLHGGVRLDPLFLIFYLIHRITNDALDLFEFVKLENRSCSIEASNYIRYRLGLFAEGSFEFIEYSKEKNCVLCSFDRSQQSD